LTAPAQRGGLPHPSRAPASYHDGAMARHRGSRLLVVSNRLPFSVHAAPGGRLNVEAGSGGLVTALLPVLRNRGGIWIGWPGTAGSSPQLRAALNAAGKGAGCELASVSLSEADVHDFYHGFSNEVVWPLFHDMSPLCNFDPAYWAAYQAVNRKYARAAPRPRA
jgi:trehalose 6-phosphate synthase/phosphatase